MATVKLTNKANGKSISPVIEHLSKKYINDFLTGKLDKRYFVWYLESKCVGLNYHFKYIGLDNLENLDIEIK